MMDIAHHPLKDPCLRIPVVSTNVEASIELKHKFFIPVLLGSHKVVQTRIMEADKGFCKARKYSNGYTIKTHMWEDAPLIVQDAKIVASLLITLESI